jgi:hypothetical protein
MRHHERNDRAAGTATIADGQDLGQLARMAVNPGRPSQVGAERPSGRAGTAPSPCRAPLASPDVHLQTEVGKDFAARGPGQVLGRGVSRLARDPLFRVRR